MKVRTVTYKRVRHSSTYSEELIMVAELDDSDNVEQCVDFLKFQVIKNLETVASLTVASISFKQMMVDSNKEMQRLGWTNQQGRDYLIKTYNKRSRQLLTDDEFLDFVNYLKGQPSPTLSPVVKSTVPGSGC